MGDDGRRKQKDEKKKTKENPIKDFLDKISTVRTERFTSNKHFDYLIKKNFVFELECQNSPGSDKGELNQLKTQQLFVNMYDVENGEQTIQNIKETIFSGNPPLNEYRNLCHTLGWTDDTLFMNSTGNMIVGLGNTNINEIAMTIHHTYGIPYIPAQAVKGMFKNYFILELIEGKKKQLQINGKTVDPVLLYKFIFGEVYGKSEDEEHLKGSVVFFDAFPWNEITVAKDIMTPHYYKYYGTKSEPVDTLDPLPILFYVVKNTTIGFHFAIRHQFLDEFPFIALGGVVSENITLTEVCAFVKEKLADALEKYGIGAKTSVGYGFFTANHELGELERKKFLKEVKEREEAIREKCEQEKMAKMTEVERLLYSKSQLPPNQKVSEIPDLINGIDQWDEDDQIKIAMFVKQYYLEEKKWDKKTNEKTSKKIEIIKKVLGEIP